jgi:hypothetical protein
MGEQLGDGALTSAMVTGSPAAWAALNTSIATSSAASVMRMALVCQALPGYETSVAALRDALGE